jgi:S1-C subfamily serine protease
MKRALGLLTAVLVLGLATASFAGEKGECTASAQECLNKMATKMANYGWTGLDGDYDEANGLYTVTSIYDNSPAVAAGFELDDVLVGINGQKFKNMSDEDWEKLSAVRVPGATVTYLVKRDGEKREIGVTLTKMPEDILATKIGHHMLDHVTVASVQ